MNVVELNTDKKTGIDVIVYAWVFKSDNKVQELQGY